MAKHVININEVELLPCSVAFPLTAADGKPELYAANIGRVSPKIGAQQLGYNITSVPPGKCALPAHSHAVNEEMFFVLQGTGEARIGSEVYPLKAGDFLACPAGGPELAHQIANTGSDDLKYLAVSTMRSPEVWQYPNSGKFGVSAALPSDEGGLPRSVTFFGRESQRVGYWDGE